MTTLYILSEIFQVSLFTAFQAYDDEGYPIDDEYLDDEDSDEEYDIPDDDDDFDDSEEWE